MMRYEIMLSNGFSAASGRIVTVLCHNQFVIKKSVIQLIRGQAAVSAGTTKGFADLKSPNSCTSNTEFLIQTQKWLLLNDNNGSHRTLIKTMYHGNFGSAFHHSCVWINNLYTNRRSPSRHSLQANSKKFRSECKFTKDKLFLHLNLSLN